MRELVRMGHNVRCFEELGVGHLATWCAEGEKAIFSIDGFRHAYPELDIRFYQSSDAASRSFLRAS